METSLVFAFIIYSVSLLLLGVFLCVNWNFLKCCPTQEENPVTWDSDWALFEVTPPRTAAEREVEAPDQPQRLLTAVPLVPSAAPVRTEQRPSSDSASDAGSLAAEGIFFPAPPTRRRVQIRTTTPPSPKFRFEPIRPEPQPSCSEV